MTIYEQCKIFKKWGATNDYFKIFVGACLTTEQYKGITGEDYVAAKEVKQNDEEAS